jgi:hypothetical protein
MDSRLRGNDVNQFSVLPEKSAPIFSKTKNNRVRKSFSPVTSTVTAWSYQFFGEPQNNEWLLIRVAFLRHLQKHNPDPVFIY